MTLTPQDVEKQTFSTALRGYDLNEVDDFLDQVVVTLTEMQTAIDAAGGAPAPAVTPLPAPPAAAEIPDESALGRVLLTAQQTADQIVADARSESERILSEAQAGADEMVTKRDEHRAQAEAEMADLTTRVSEVRNKLAVLATAVADRLDEMDDTIASTLSAGDGADLTTSPEVENEEGDEGNVYAIGSAPADDDSEDSASNAAMSDHEDATDDDDGDDEEGAGDEEESADEAADDSEDDKGPGDSF